MRLFPIILFIIWCCLLLHYLILSISNYIMFFAFQVNLYIYNDIFHLVPAILPAGELFLYHHVSLKSYSTSKGTQHDIVSISRCLHLEHLLFLFFSLCFLYCTKCIYKSFKSFSLNLHTVSVPQQIFCIGTIAQRVKYSEQMQKNSYKTPFLKSYSFAIHDIKLLFNIWISNGLAVCC